MIDPLPPLITNIRKKVNFLLANPKEGGELGKLLCGLMVRYDRLVTRINELGQAWVMPSRHLMEKLGLTVPPEQSEAEFWYDYLNSRLFEKGQFMGSTDRGGYAMVASGVNMRDQEDIERAVRWLRENYPQNHTYVYNGQSFVWVSFDEWLTDEKWASQYYLSAYLGIGGKIYRKEDFK